MRIYPYVRIIALILIALTIVGIVGSERFTSTGTILQLQTSHVLTPEELQERECRSGLYGCVYKYIPFGF
jgi:hypothetical protein